MEDVSQETEQVNSGEIRDERGRFKPGFTGNPLGKPEGTISPIQRVKQIFREDPERFAEFLEGYIKDANNRKHIVEMIDGKPMQKTDVTSNGESLTPILVKFIDNEDHRNPDRV